MPGFRFSIAGFFVVLTLVAVGLAALVSQSALAGSAAYTAFVILICLAPIGAILRPLPARAFWLGIAIFGWTYWFIEFDTEAAVPRSAFIGGLSFTTTPNGTANRPGLVSRELLAYFASQLTASRTVGSKVMGQWRSGNYYSGTIGAVNEDQYLIVWDDGSPQQWTPSRQIMASSPMILVAGHALLGGMFALLGGVLAAALFGSTKIAPAVSSGPRTDAGSGAAARP